MGYEVRANLDLSIAYFNAKSSILPHCQCCRSESSIVVCNVRLIPESCIKEEESFLLLPITPSRLMPVSGTGRIPTGEDGSLPGNRAGAPFAR